MAVQIRGVQPLAWGTETITGTIVESTTRDVSTEEFVIEDEEGHIVGHITGFGEKTEYSIDIIPLSTFVTPPAPADVLTVGTEKMVILSISKKGQKKEVEKWSIKGVSHPGITLT
jgi:hypothetical protein